MCSRVEVDRYFIFAALEVPIFRPMAKLATKLVGWFAVGLTVYFRASTYLD